MSASDEIIHELIKRITIMEREVQRLSSLNPLYEILNSSSVVPVISANQNNYDPGDYDSLNLDPTSTFSVSGFTGGVLGRRLMIRNASNTLSSLSILHEGAGSTATNRIRTQTAGTLTLTARNSMLMEYMATAVGNRWVILFSL